MLDDEFFSKKPVIGVVHLPPLPGSPQYNGRHSLEDIVERALSDARIYVENGVDGVIVENFMDTPFAVRVTEPETLCAVSVVAWELKKELSVPLGINILRNSGVEAVSIACSLGIDFIRVNALAEPVWAPEGLLIPLARSIWLKKRLLGCSAKIFADVNVKHGVSLFPLDTAVKEAIERGLADALVVTGERTGTPPLPGTVYYVKKISSKPVIVGSGVNLENIRVYFGISDGFIVGTFFKKNGVTRNPTDPQRVRRFMEVVKELRGNAL